VAPLCATYVCTRQLQLLPENPVQVLVHVSHHLIVTVATQCHGELRVINRPTYTLYQNKESHREGALHTAFQSLTLLQK
jgi:hypothetical protein